MGNHAQRDWVLQVLGLDLEAARAAQAGKQSRLAEALRTWRFVRREAVASLQALQIAFMETGKPLGRYIARGGLREVLADHLALIDQAINRLGNTKRPTLAKLPDAAKGLRAALGAIRGDARLSALESNPFGVAVNFRVQLSGAIDALLGAFDIIQSNSLAKGAVP